MKTERRKVIGINLELSAHTSALHGVRVLIEADHNRREPLAILGLVIARLDLLRAVVRGEIDPAQLWAEHSATVPAEDARATDDGELRLEAWTPETALSRLDVQRTRLRRMLEADR
jgi:hypothetical protein